MTKIVSFDKCIIIHGCPLKESSVLPKSKRWMNWLENALKTKAIPAIAPDMPTPWSPNYQEWKTVIEKLSVTQNTILVGHSCSAAFLVHWLLETGIKVKKLILVAPAKIPETADDARKPLYDFELPTSPVRLAEETVIFVSNDLDRHLKSFELYKQALNPRVIRLENKGHFLIFTMGTNEFPELLNEVLATE